MMKVRKGFTLVELLIVIVIIGILAAAMMLSSGSATASAEASNIVTDLRSMKAAALMLYADSMDEFNTGFTGVTVDHLAPYMDNPTKFAAIAGTRPYKFTIDGGTNKWWVGYNLTEGKKVPEVAKKLAGKAGSIGLYQNTSTYATSNLFTASGTEVWMVAR
jgi:general secretion pathway protein G